MDFVDDIKSRIEDYLDDEYEIIDAEDIPSVEDLSFGNKAKRMNLCTLCIDLRKSTDLMYIHDEPTSGRIHKAFLTLVSKVVREFDGQIRSFQGDSLLAFWPAQTSDDLEKVIKAAMVIKWLLDDELSYLFEQFTKLDFGIGIHLSEVYILRAGISRDTNNNDLIFIGESINFAVALANRAKRPYHIAISNSVYRNLEDEWKNRQVFFFLEYRIWEKSSFRWQGRRRTIMLTKHDMKID